MIALDQPLVRCQPTACPQAERCARATCTPEQRGQIDGSAVRSIAGCVLFIDERAWRLVPAIGQNLTTANKTRPMEKTL